MKRYIRSSSESGVILYRSGSTEPSIISNSRKGVFFSTSPEYFYNHSKMDFKEEFKAYRLSSNARVWDPEQEFELFGITSYDNICCLMSDLEKFGIDDECDWELDEKYGVTSTDGLAIAGKNLGYDATAIRNVWYAHGYFDEYAVYNPNVIKPL